MQTHKDYDHEHDKVRQMFLDRLEDRAGEMERAQAALLTAGGEDEQPLDRWKHGGVTVREMPPDEQDILRISVGGGPNLPVSVNYCVFRGNRHHCIHLLKRALAALEARDGDAKDR